MRILDWADFLRATTTIFVQDKKLLRIISSSADLHQLDSLVHVISRLCRLDTPFIKMFYVDNKKSCWKDGACFKE